MNIQIEQNASYLFEVMVGPEKLGSTQRLITHDKEAYITDDFCFVLPQESQSET